jgi:phage gp36-like protein
MPYATPADVARVATRGWDDIAQRAVQNARVSGETMRLLYSGGSMAGVAADVLELAQRGLEHVEDVLERTSRHADTYIQPRYQGQLPLPAHLVAGSDLPTVVATIAYRRLMGTALSEDADRNTAWAEKYLRDLADGRVTFGATDTATPQPPGRMASSAPCKTIDWDRY